MSKVLRESLPGGRITEQKRVLKNVDKTARLEK